jgi:predicted DNA-binding transcriptional regulator AlpA
MSRKARSRLDALHARRDAITPAGRVSGPWSRDRIARQNDDLDRPRILASPQAARPPPIPLPLLDQPRVLNRRDVIELTGFSYVTLWKWMREGKFPRALDLNGHPVWRSQDIDRFLADLPIRKFKGDLDDEEEE